MFARFEYQRLGGGETAYCRYARTIAKTSLVVAASFTLSWMFLAYPMVVGNLGVSAEENKKNLAAADFVLAFLQIVLSSAHAPVFAVNAEVVNRCVGRIQTLIKDGGSEEDIKVLQDEIARALKNGIFLGLLSSLCWSFPIAYAKNILLSLHQNPELAAKAANALKWSVPSVSFVVLRLLMEQILIPLGQEKLMTQMALACFLMGALPTAYLVGKEEGLSGVTAGFVLGDALTAIVFTLAVKYHPPLAKFGLLRWKHFCSWHKDDAQQLGALTKTGALYTVMTTIQLSSGFVESMLTGVMGNTALAALTLSTQIGSLAAPFIFSCGTVTQRETAQANGAQHYHEVQENARAGLAVTQALILPICIAACAYPRMLTAFMGSPIDEETLSLVDTVAIWMGVRALAVSAANNACQILIGIGDGSVATALLVLSQLSGVALGALLAFYTDVSSNPLTALVAGGTICQSLGALALVVREHQQLKPEALEKRAEAVPTAEPNCFRTAVNSLWSAGSRAVSWLMPQIVA